MGAWIEINVGIMYDSENNVAPLVGAWIEINDELDEMSESLVAPLVGAWIEMSRSWLKSTHPMSLPSWERGLKLVQT